ncbi:membrane protein [Streptomyces laurentii]|uniref:Membrane protein n=1 Tax=Streptomyces laurentii TaxID=39478 RepID=A0A169NPP9_STRLU|nr:membrane protein [Streptomyces laurentii]
MTESAILVQAGDTLALVVQSRKAGVETVPFRQTVILQTQLLG